MGKPFLLKLKFCKLAALAPLDCLLPRKQWACFTTQNQSPRTNYIPESLSDCANWRFYLDKLYFYGR
uniref:Secreted protein n=1 Tax=Tupiella akineta TaxID=160070 RepID=Q6UVS5_TUPAK|nr:hypothetical protein PsakpMp37 [Tupiella akineta]AAQ18749.1 hypothetical protein [Tupiella akineta]